MDNFLKDIRYGWRGLTNRPGFTAIVIVTLALGIGASTAIFSVVNSVMLRRLPYSTADRIVAIQELSPEGRRIQTTAANFYDWRQQNTVFEHLAAIKQTSANLALADHADRIDLAQTSANFFDVFGAKAQSGRLFIPADEQAGHESIVVIGDELWRRRFGSDPGLVGRQSLSTETITPSSALRPRVFIIPIRLKHGCRRCDSLPSCFQRWM